MDPITRMQWIDLRVSIAAALSIQDVTERYKADIAATPQKKQRGAFLSAWFRVHGLRDDLMECFEQGRPGHAYWCWYAVLCEDLRALLLQHPKAGEWTR